MAHEFTRHSDSFNPKRSVKRYKVFWWDAQASAWKPLEESESLKEAEEKSSDFAIEYNTVTAVVCCLSLFSPPPQNVARKDKWE